MKNKILIYLILTLITGLIGFTGLSFYGIIGVRIVFLFSAVMLIITLLAKVFFRQEKEMKPVKVKK